MREFKVGDRVQVKYFDQVGTGEIVALSPIGEYLYYEVRYFFKDQWYRTIFRIDEMKLLLNETTTNPITQPSKPIIHGKGQGQWEN